MTQRGPGVWPGSQVQGRAGQSPLLPLPRGDQVRAWGSACPRASGSRRVRTWGCVARPVEAGLRCWPRAHPRRAAASPGAGLRPQEEGGGGSCSVFLPVHPEHPPDKAPGLPCGPRPGPTPGCLLGVSATVSVSSDALGHVSRVPGLWLSARFEVSRPWPLLGHPSGVLPLVCKCTCEE